MDLIRQECENKKISMNFYETYPENEKFWFDMADKGWCPFSLFDKYTKRTRAAKNLKLYKVLQAKITKEIQSSVKAYHAKGGNRTVYQGKEMSTEQYMFTRQEEESKREEETAAVGE